MSAALFLLTVNFLIAQLFCVCFLIVSRRSRQPAASRWFAFAYCVASLSVLGELAIRYADFDRLASFAAFSSILSALLMIRIGIGRLYAVPINVTLAGIFFAVSLTVNLLIYDLPRSTWQNAIGYQSPFFVAMMACSLAVYRSGRRGSGDLILMVLTFLTAMQFLAKIYFNVNVGAGPDAQAYLSSGYALISQSLGAVLTVSVGLTLLAVLVVEIMDEAKAQSEIDPLSQLCNRRGFDARVAQILARPITPLPHTLVVCDIDLFKSINDTYGHMAGDRVIHALGQMLLDRAPHDAVCARLGGEEFAVFLPGANETVGYLFAQGLRTSLPALQVPGIPSDVRLTASFGVCSLENSGDVFDEVMRRADAALYEAKRSGRNRVSRATEPVPPDTIEFRAKA